MARLIALTTGIGGLLVLAACGSDRADPLADDSDHTGQAGSSVGAPDDLVPDDYTGRFRVPSVTVLASPEHGPQLCSYLAESFPPQCEGPDIIGWDWSGLEHDAAHGTTWGTYQVVGTFDDGVFTLTEPPTAPSSPPRNEKDPVSPCPEPPSGWEIPDPSTANPDDLERAISTAHDVKGYAGGWIGWLIADDEVTERTAADPQNFVLNVRTADDRHAMEATVREIWGGKLCVATAEHTTRELNQIANEVADTPGMVSVGTDEVELTVDIGVWVATESLWKRLTAEYGADVIDLDGMLQPIDVHK